MGPRIPSCFKYHAKVANVPLKSILQQLWAVMLHTIANKINRVVFKE